MKEPKHSTKPPASTVVGDSLLPAASIAPIVRSNIVEVVATRLRADILAGRIAPGSRLPAERELATMLGVNRLTLRASLAQLEALGFITTRHGSGSVVNNWRQRAGLEAVSSVFSALDPSEVVYEHFVGSVLEFRRAIAAEIFALAMGKVTKESYARLEAIHATMVQKLDDPLAFAEEDINFMRELCVAVDNVCFELVLNTFARLRVDAPEFVKLLYADCADWAKVYPIGLKILKTGQQELAWTTLRQALEARDGIFLRSVFGAKSRATRTSGPR